MSESWYKCDGVCTLQLLLGGGCGWVCGGCGVSELWYKCDGVCTLQLLTRWRVWVGVWRVWVGGWRVWVSGWRVWVSESWYKCDGVCTLQLLLGGGCGWVCGGCG